MSDTKLLRDQFAMAALQGELASQSVEVGEITNKPESLAANAERCYAIADAMIAASGTPDPRIEAAKGMYEALEVMLTCVTVISRVLQDRGGDRMPTADAAVEMAKSALAAWEKLQ